MIKAIIFDCYGVFYVDPIFTYLNDPASSPKTAKALHDLDKQLVANLISQDEFTTKAAKLLETTKDSITKQFFMPSARNMELLQYSQELRKSYKVGMLSNVGSEVMNDYFSKEEREEFFDDVVLSGDVGFAKPDPKIFELICERLGVSSKEAVMIDDLPEFCEGARTTGMSAIVYTNNRQLKTDLERLIND